MKPDKRPVWELSAEELAMVIDELETERDRGAALLGHALLEDALRGLLLSHMTKLPKEFQGEIFENFGPVSSMSARVQISFAFGLIDSTIKADLDNIRRIRNRFAHTGRSLDFNDDDVSNKASALIRWDTYHDKITDPRARYDAAVRTLLLRIHSASRRASAIAK